MLHGRVCVMTCQNTPFSILMSRDHTQSYDSLHWPGTTLMKIVWMINPEQENNLHSCIFMADQKQRLTKLNLNWRYMTQYNESETFLLIQIKFTKNELEDSLFCFRCFFNSLIQADRTKTWILRHLFQDETRRFPLVGANNFLTFWPTMVMFGHVKRKVKNCWHTIWVVHEKKYKFSIICDIFNRFPTYFDVITDEKRPKYVKNRGATSWRHFQVIRWRHKKNLIYWAKVLPEQWELIQIFRKHEIFRKKLRTHFEQAIIHLSKSLNFILIKCLQIT